MSARDCWCNSGHPEGRGDIFVEWPRFWHTLLAEMRIPQLVARLAAHLPSPRGPR